MEFITWFLVSISMTGVGFIIGWFVRGSNMVPHDSVKAINFYHVSRGGDPQLIHIDEYNGDYFSSVGVQTPGKVKVWVRNKFFSGWEKKNFMEVDEDDILPIGNGEDKITLLGLKKALKLHFFEEINSLRVRVKEYRNKYYLLQEEYRKKSDEMQSLIDKGDDRIKSMHSALFPFTPKSSSGGKK